MLTSIASLTARFRPHPRDPALKRFADGESASPEERACIARHLERCAECRATLSWVRGAGALLRTARTPAPPAGMLERIAAERAAGERFILPSADERRAPRSAPAWMAAAATVLVAAGIAGTAGVQRWRNGSDASRAPAHAAARAVPGDSVPTGSGFLVAVGVLPAEAYAQELPTEARGTPPRVVGLDGGRLRAGRWEYEFAEHSEKGAASVPERGAIVIEEAEHGGRPAWRVFDAWRGHTNDMAETTYVDRRTLRPLYRRALNVGYSHYDVAQRFMRDSVLGTMTGRGRVTRIARALPASGGPYAAGEGFFVLFFQSVVLKPGWSGSVSVVGWGAVPSDVVYPVSIRVLGEERVRIPAGAFDCWKLSVRVRGEPEQTVWVRASDGLLVMSRRIVRGGSNQVTLVSAPSTSTQPAER